MSRIPLVLAACVVAGSVVCGCASHTPAAPMAAQAPSRPALQVRVLDVPVGRDAAIVEKVPAMRAIVTDRPSNYDASSSVALVTKRSAGLARQATYITVAHVLATKLDSSAYRDVPTWMVTFHGITDSKVTNHVPGSSDSALVTGLNFAVFLGQDGDYLMGDEYKP